MANEPPQDVNAEMAVLGSMLLSPVAIAAATEALTADHFYTPNHASIFSAITDIAASGLPVDSVTLADELRSRGDLDRVGAPYILTLMENTPTATNITSYTRIVYDKWRQRKIIETGRRFIAIGHTEASDTEEVDSLLAEADGFFRDLSQPSQSGLSWDQLVQKWRVFQEETGGIIPTPWSEMNSYLNGGGHFGQMIIIGGRPGAGKSMGGLNYALDAAENGHKTVIFSVEMDDVEVASRLLAAGSRANQAQIMARRMKPETHADVEYYISSRQGMQLEVVDEAYLTVEKIVAHCRLRRPELIFVDYAQLLTASNTNVSREQQVAHITRSLKVAAKHLQMVVVVAAQLNRGPVDRVPVISDLRESGAAEQDSDVVLLLHAPPDDPGIVQLIVGKNRNGPTGSVDLVMRGDIARIG